ncbi:phosphogluconate dehydrogenase (NAD(+)-dependent, decarboxylating) [Geothrix fuzhouensis]|uniref:phosphogluconate dehydrogenase (NAD(+)-dependent, decarboxylating) n=1 Tax=Geothrix fuzhouensis TaxID=2966451 RepID=UPI0021499418|nr:decarboxylating 6-phosphogluconate dehydrogenase [Geothrix fuzhouensis]
MDIGMIGLGRMGAGMARRLAGAGHRVVGFDPDGVARGRLQGHGLDVAGSLEALAGGLPGPRVFWLMVPAGEKVDQTIDALLPLLSAGDVIIDGGNSHYKDTLRRAATVAGRQIHFLDCGTSGGVWGLTEGYCLMVGGDPAVIERLRPIFGSLAPEGGGGWGRVGPCGAGHFAKMVHNGIEYGLMQAYAEGFSILRHKEAFGLDVRQIAEIWRHGSVVRSWLLDLVASALAKPGGLVGIAPYVADSGEGRWAVDEAIDLDVPAPVITQALIQRLRSRDAESFSDRLVAAMRHEFGGHPVKEE